MPVDFGNIVKSVEMLKRSMPEKGFNQSIDLIINLKDLDLKRSESKLNELVELPHAVSKPLKICVIASGDLHLRAQRAGVDLLLDREGLERLGGDKKAGKALASSYDMFFAEATMMPLIGRILGGYLGPRGKMPTPVPPNAPIEAIIERGRRSVRVRVKDQPVIQCRVGGVDMDVKQVAENVLAVVNRVEARLERGSRNIGEILLKTTMSAPVKVPLG
ncbi:MAG: 50S ribosomal protein L1 [Candidatus Bathyarchaeia archaeon]